jgi:hypothetical protein
MFYLLSLYLFTCNDVQQTMFVSSYSNIIGAKLRTVFVSATEHGSSAGYNSGEYRYDNVTLSPLLLQRGKSGLRVTYSYLWRVVCGPELETLRSLHRCYQWCMKCLTYPEHLRWPAAIWCGSVIFCKFYVLLVRECVFFHVFLTPFCRAISTYVYFMFRISLLFWITFYILGAVVAVMMAWSYGSWFTTTYAISADHNLCCEFEPRSGRGVQHYVIKFVSDLWQVGGFLRVLWCPSPIKLTATI